MIEQNCIQVFEEKRQKGVKKGQGERQREGQRERQRAKRETKGETKKEAKKKTKREAKRKTKREAERQRKRQRKTKRGAKREKKKETKGEAMKGAEEQLQNINMCTLNCQHRERGKGRSTAKGKERDLIIWFPRFLGRFFQGGSTDLFREIYSNTTSDWFL